MKSLFVLLVSTIALMVSPVAAQAEVKTGVTIRSISFDGRMLEVLYMVGGGCADHRGDVEFVIDEATQTVAMNVVDITEKGDPCEAIIPGTVKVDVIDTLKPLMAARGLEPYGYQLVLPKMRLEVF